MKHSPYPLPVSHARAPRAFSMTTLFMAMAGAFLAGFGFAGALFDFFARAAQ